MITAETLAGIKVLFRAPDSMALYGIPYEMRRDVRQEPRHLYNSSHAKARNGWIWLGSPGWFGTLSKEERDLLIAYLTRLDEQSLIPERPYEWVDLVREGVV